MVFSSFVYVLEIFKQLKVVQPLSATLNNFLGAVLDEVVHQGEAFVHMAPVLPMIIQPLPHHVHDLREGGRVESHVTDG